MKKLILFLLLVCCTLVHAQTTTTTATVQFPDGQVFGGGSVTANFLPPTGIIDQGKYTLNGAQFPYTVTGTMNSAGTFTLILTDEFKVMPQGGRWQFTLCSITNVAPCQVVVADVFGASINLTTLLNAGITNIFSPAQVYSRLFADTEVNTDVNGGNNYFNPFTKVVRYWDGSAWHTLCTTDALTNCGNTTEVAITTYGAIADAKVIQSGGSGTSGSHTLTCSTCTFTSADATAHKLISINQDPAPPPVLPVITTATGGSCSGAGTIAANQTVYIWLAYVNANGEGEHSFEAFITPPSAGSCIKITSPTTTASNGVAQTSYKVYAAQDAASPLYAGLASGTEALQNASAQCNNGNQTIGVGCELDTINVGGATPPAPSQLVTTISSFNSSTSVNVTAALTKTFTGMQFSYGTDSYPAWVSAQAVANAFPGNMCIMIPPGSYMLGSTVSYAKVNNFPCIIGSGGNGGILLAPSQTLAYGTTGTSEIILAGPIYGFSFGTSGQQQNTGPFLSNFSVMDASRNGTALGAFKMFGMANSVLQDISVLHFQNGNAFECDSVVNTNFCQFNHFERVSFVDDHRQIYFHGGKESDDYIAHSRLTGTAYGGDIGIDLACNDGSTPGGGGFFLDSVQMLYSSLFFHACDKSTMHISGLRTENSFTQQPNIAGGNGYGTSILIEGHSGHGFCIDNQIIGGSANFTQWGAVLGNTYGLSTTTADCYHMTMVGYQTDAVNLSAKQIVNNNPYQNTLLNGFMGVYAQNASFKDYNNAIIDASQACTDPSSLDETCITNAEALLKFSTFGGGTVYVPAATVININNPIQIGDTTNEPPIRLLLDNNAQLIVNITDGVSNAISICDGSSIQGIEPATAPINSQVGKIVLAATGNVNQLVTNCAKDGTQGTVDLEDVLITEKAGGTVASGLVNFTGVTSGTDIKSVLITQSTGVGLELACVTNFLCADAYLEDVIVKNLITTGGIPFKITAAATPNGGFSHLTCVGCKVSGAGANQPEIKITGNTAGGGNSNTNYGIAFNNLAVIASASTNDGVDIIDSQSVMFDGLSATVGVAGKDAVNISQTGASQTSNIVILSAYQTGYTNLINDTINTLTYTDVHIPFYAIDSVGYAFNWQVNGTLKLATTFTDAPGAITVNAQTCTERTVTTTGSASGTGIVSISAGYAMEANLSLSPGQVSNNSSKYRICNNTAGNITLGAGSTFKLKIIN